MAFDIAIIEPMTKQEAQTCLHEIKSHLSDARRKVLELYERRGWEALGYESFQACMERELGYSFQHGYRLVMAEKIEQSIRQHSPQGELPSGSIPEKHLRVLKKVQDPQQRARAYQNARDLAATEGAKQVKTRHVEQSVLLEETRQMVLKSRYFLPAQMMVRGEVTPYEAKRMIEALEELTPRRRGYVLQLMAEPGLTCPELIIPIGNMFDRPEGRESYVLPEILQAGTLGGTPLHKAAVVDLQRANEEARRQHIADAEEKKRPVIEPVIVTVYRGDPARSLKALVSALGHEGLEEVFKHFVQS